MIPIGDRFTMGLEGAAFACKKFFKSVRYIIPMHYGTFPMLSGTFEDLQTELKKKGVDAKLLVETLKLTDIWNVDLKTIWFLKIFINEN